MAEVPRYIINASVVTKWHLRDEEYVPQALTILNNFQQGRIDLLAPRHIQLEVASSILKASRRGRLSRQDASASIDLIGGWGLTLLAHPPLGQVRYYAEWLTTSFYDGLFVATSVLTQYPLLSADHHLRNAARDKFPFVPQKPVSTPSADSSTLQESRRREGTRP